RRRGARRRDDLRGPAPALRVAEPAARGLRARLGAARAGALPARARRALRGARGGPRRGEAPADVGGVRGLRADGAYAGAAAAPAPALPPPRGRGRGRT